MGRKLSALVTVGVLAFTSAAYAKSFELEGDFGDSHPGSEVTAKVQIRGGQPTLVKVFEFSGLLAECEGAPGATVSGDSSRPAEIVERPSGKLRFEIRLIEEDSAARVDGKVSRSGKALSGTIDYSGEAGGGCEAEADFELER
jgi:hypothetical protein